MKKSIILTLIATFAFAGNVCAVTLDTVDSNTTLNTYRSLEDNSKPIVQVVDGIVDAFVDASGVSFKDSSYIKVSTTDESGKNHTINLEGDAVVSDGNFGGLAIDFDGSGDYLTIPDSPDWDIVGSAIQDWTLDFWIKMDDYTSAATIFTLAENASNRYTLFHANSHFRFKAYTSGPTIIDTGYVNGITDDTGWHHVALVIDYNGSYRNTGIYVDGKRKGYIENNNTTDTYNPTNLLIGEDFDGYNSLNGSIYGLRLQKSNIFDADPLSADDISIPTSAPVKNDYTVLLIKTSYDDSYLTPIASETMNIVSQVFTAETAATDAKLVVLAEDTATAIDETDITANVTCDGGFPHTTITLDDNGKYESGKHILTGSSAVSCNPSDKNMAYKLSTSEDTIRIHGVGLSWE